MIPTSTDRLTKREAEILSLKAKGYEWKQITTECRICKDTLKTNLVNIRRKLDASNTTHAVAIAKDKGLI